MTEIRRKTLDVFVDDNAAGPVQLRLLVNMLRILSESICRFDISHIKHVCPDRKSHQDSITLCAGAGY